MLTVDLLRYIQTPAFLAHLDPPLRAWWERNDERAAVVMADALNALETAKEYERLRLRLPKSSVEMKALGEKIAAFDLDKTKRWKKIIPRQYAIRFALTANVERVEGEVRWVRKDLVKREDGTTKNIVVGTRVLGKRPPHAFRPGVIVATASDEVAKRRAKEAVGTTQAVQVRFDP